MQLVFFVLNCFVEGLRLAPWILSVLSLLCSLRIFRSCSVPLMLCVREVVRLGRGKGCCAQFL